MTRLASTCSERGCGERILWAITEKGRRMPLNVHPDAEGRVAIYRNAGGAYVARVLREGEQPDAHERVHMPHFATCKPRLERERAQAAIKRANRATPGVVVPFRPKATRHARR